MTLRLVDKDNYPTRIQFSLYDTLVAEVIVERNMADRTLAAYAIAKYKKGLPIGGSCMSHISTRRMWNVPVGSIIPSKESK